ncbi:MAG: putative lipoprotein precursor [Bacteroidetes bacterium]|jgi:hypothetical protein|nr:putative lipoprotein precursor [Bacteroidota bacterium]
MRLFLLFILSLLISSCAQIVPLSGGTIDQAAPKLLIENPANGSLNFSGNIIIIKFDEYIQLKDLFNQLIITPQLKKQPDIEASGKILTVKFDEQLKENTTYTLFFGNSICDITEGNPVANYEYTFSTGNYIDSLKISGTLKDAYTGFPVKDAWGMLYFDAADSSIYTSKPDYLARSNEKGEFTIRGLKQGSYKLIALVDKNKNYLYDNGEQMGFADTLITVPVNDTVALSLNMFTERSSRAFLKKTDHPSPEKVILTFNTPPDSINSIRIYTPQGSSVTSYSYKMSGLRDSVFLNFSNTDEDSIYIKVNYNAGQEDSALVTFLSKKQLNEQFDRKRLPLELMSPYKNSSSLPYYIPHYKVYSSFNIKQTDKALLLLKENGKAVDSSRIKISMGNPDSIYISYKWKEESEYDLYLLKGFASDMQERSNDSLHFAFKTSDKSDYGSLKVNLSGLRPGNYMLQLINSAYKVIYERRLLILSDEAQEIVFSDVLPDTYRLRVVSDTNKDNAFTPGNYLRKQHAEEVFISDQTIKIISDWDNELKWEIKK